MQLILFSHLYFVQHKALNRIKIYSQDMTSFKSNWSESDLFQTEAGSCDGTLSFATKKTFGADAAFGIDKNVCLE
jgi:hypothetical protein